jgi:2-polyprenyl-3-methyl-5-hydroxy-6-metoxy-1,4-benzoquinol methylase
MSEGLPTTAAASNWEANAKFWITIIRDRRDRYRTELTDAAVLGAIGDCAGLDVLDAGCGEGYLSRELAGRGAASVLGVDRSAELIAAARDAARAPGMAFTEGDADDLPAPAGSVDLVVANHLLNDLPDVAGPVAEFARVLRPGGRLVALMLHPCFYGYRAEVTPLDGIPDSAAYFTQQAVVQAFEVDGLTSPAETISWVRPLEAYTGALATSGLHITALTEPHPSPEQLAGSAWWRENFPRPLFVLLTAVKPRDSSLG